MSINVGINGFGRIGRNVLRQAMIRKDASEINITHINDLTSVDSLAYLLKYDSIHGKASFDVQTDGDNALIVNGKKIKITQERDPSKLGWDATNTNVVLECTGIFRTKEKASQHIAAGAKKVVISAPSSNPDITIVYGVNHDAYDPSKHDVISNASCTTNCLAPVAKVLLDTFGIKRGTMTTIHSYTNDQRILDLPHSDPRRARAAAISMIPTSTGAAKAVGLVLPVLNGKVDGFAIRVPTPDVSIVDFVAETEKSVTKESVNAALKSASEGALNGVLAYSEEPLVSCDYIGCPASSTVDAPLTMVIQDNLVKVVSWYDNEMGFSSRMVDVCKLIGG